MSSIYPPLNEPISPELALVCPDLAERARQLMAARPLWAAPVERREAPTRVRPLEFLAPALGSILVAGTPFALALLAAVLDR
ncbi:MAG TPA: hypothetical protein VKB10_10995 [Gaiellaceae bacterium]|jgi:hypothetical protein|nr:hypothetical protein [Gaiellaceae bacterium]